MTETSGTSNEPPKRGQFSLATLMGAVTTAALIAWLVRPLVVSPTTFSDHVAWGLLQVIAMLAAISGPCYAMIIVLRHEARRLDDHRD